MDQRLIFVAMMLLIFPSIAAEGKNTFFFSFLFVFLSLYQFNLFEIHFWVGGDRWKYEKERKRALQLLQRVSI